MLHNRKNNDITANLIFIEKINDLLKSNKAEIIISADDINKANITYLDQALLLHSNSITCLVLNFKNDAGSNSENSYLDLVIKLLGNHKSITYLKLYDPNYRQDEWEKFKENTSLLKVDIYSTKNTFKDKNGNLDSSIECFKNYTSVIDFNFYDKNSVVQNHIFDEGFIKKFKIRVSDSLERNTTRITIEFGDIDQRCIEYLDQVLSSRPNLVNCLVLNFQDDTIRTIFKTAYLSSLITLLKNHSKITDLEFYDVPFARKEWKRFAGNVSLSKITIYSSETQADKIFAYEDNVIRSAKEILPNCIQIINFNYYNSQLTLCSWNFVKNSIIKSNSVSKTLTSKRKEINENIIKYLGEILSSKQSSMTSMTLDLQEIANLHPRADILDPLIKFIIDHQVTGLNLINPPSSIEWKKFDRVNHLAEVSIFTSKTQLDEVENYKRNVINPALNAFRGHRSIREFIYYTTQSGKHIYNFEEDFSEYIEKSLKVDKKNFGLKAHHSGLKYMEYLDVYLSSKTNSVNRLIITLPEHLEVEEIFYPTLIKFLSNHKEIYKLQLEGVFGFKSLGWHEFSKNSSVSEITIISKPEFTHIGFVSPSKAKTVQNDHKKACLLEVEFLKEIFEGTAILRLNFISKHDHLGKFSRILEFDRKTNDIKSTEKN